MTTDIIIRPAVAADCDAMRIVLETSGLFPPEMLEDMIAPYLGGGTAELWLVATVGGCVRGLAYCVPERMTNGTWNLLAIAVDAEWQGQGIGRAMMTHVEQLLAADAARILIAETSGLNDYADTRRFYASLGYGEEARLRDFYDSGDDKIVFRKALDG